jgi:hypothetical protein
LILSTNEDRKKAPKVHLQNDKFTLAAFRMNEKAILSLKNKQFYDTFTIAWNVIYRSYDSTWFLFPNKSEKWFQHTLSNEAAFSSFEVFIYSFFCSNICTEGGMNLFHCGLKNIYRLVNIHFSGEKNVDSFR